MTDLKNRFAEILNGEPAAPDDLGRIVASGRRALRRRNALTVIAGAAGTAAVTSAVVVPIAATTHDGGVNKIAVLSSSTPAKLDKVHCEFYLQRQATKTAQRRELRVLRKKADRSGVAGTTIETRRLAHGGTVFADCPPGASPKGTGDGSMPSPTNALPAYHYTEDPTTISARLGQDLTKQVKALGFTIVFQRPFAQESSTLEKGRPSYFGGNVDVQLPAGPADIGVQVTHEVTKQVPFDGSCTAPKCAQSTLADGSVVRTSRVSAGGGGTVIVVEVHRPDGLVVQAQQSNYGFGPEATSARSSQPLTLNQLTALAEDPTFAF